LAKKEAKERQPQLSSVSQLVRAPTPVGLTEEELVAVLNREMDRRRQEEEQRAVEARRIQQMETERLRRQSLESTRPLLCLCRPLTNERLYLLPLKNRESSMNIMIVAFSHLRH